MERFGQFLARERSFDRLWSIYLGFNGLGLLVLGVFAPLIFESGSSPEFSAFWLKLRLVAIVGGVALVGLTAVRVRSNRDSLRRRAEDDASRPAPKG